MASAHRLEVARIRELLQYDPKTGALTWRVSRRRVEAGTVAGYVCKSHGYRLVGIEGKEYFAHRLIWAMVTGIWPNVEVDHEDGDKGRNVWSNLRLASHSQNGMNKGAMANNTSGFKGVTWHRKSGKWMAQIGAAKSRTYLGLHTTPKEAHEVYLAAAAGLHGAFAKAA